jgi:triacylglycerol lipase
VGPLLQHVPFLVVDVLRHNAGGLHDLTTAFGEQFDATTPDVPGVRYIEVAGDASRGGDELLLFRLAAILGEIESGPNDGVVTRRSALIDRPGHEHLPDWPVDHAGEVGWSVRTPFPIILHLPFLPPPPHFARYDAIVDAL